MRVLLDTNILARCIEPKHAQHLTAMRAVENLIRQGEDLWLIPQVLCEYFVICTRPVSTNGGLGMSNATAIAEIKRLLTTFKLVGDSEAIFELWLEMVEHRGTVGKGAHDVRIAAAMIAHQIPAILTFNLRHFQGYPQIRAIDPAEV